MGKVKEYIKLRRYERYLLLLFSRYLKGGFFYICFKERKVAKPTIRDIFSKKVFHIHFLFHKNKAGFDNVLFSEGGLKYVLLFPSYVVCIPYDSRELNIGAITTYNRCKLVALKCLPLFPYPFAKIYHFEDDIKHYYMERIFGVHKNDFSHNQMMIVFLLKLSLECPIDKNNNTYIQHGDAKPDSILWVDERPIFIDLDSVNYYPLLFDVVHFAAISEVGVNELISIIISNLNLLNDLLLKFEIKYKGLTTLDVIFCNYVEFCKSHYNNTVAFYFFNCLDKTHFPLTAKIIRR